MLTRGRSGGYRQHRRVNAACGECGRSLVDGQASKGATVWPWQTGPLRRPRPGARRGAQPGRGRKRAGHPVRNSGWPAAQPSAAGLTPKALDAMGHRQGTRSNWKTTKNRQRCRGTRSHRERDPQRSSGTPRCRWSPADAAAAPRPGAPCRGVPGHRSTPCNNV